jgi:hypothetical protein
MIVNPFTDSLFSKNIGLNLEDIIVLGLTKKEVTNIARVNRTWKAYTDHFKSYFDLLHKSHFNVYRVCAYPWHLAYAIKQINFKNFIVKVALLESEVDEDDGLDDASGIEAFQPLTLVSKTWPSFGSDPFLTENILITKTFRISTDQTHIVDAISISFREVHSKLDMAYLISNTEKGRARENCRLAGLDGIF